MYKAVTDINKIINYYFKYFEEYRKPMRTFNNR